MKGIWVWDLRWKREWFEWEKHMVDELFALINNANIEDIGENYWIWTVNLSNSFKLKFTYLTLHNLKIGSHEVRVFKRLWQIKISNKIFFMIWRILHVRLSKKINVHKRQILDDGLACVWCNWMHEDIFNVLFSCKVA